MNFHDAMALVEDRFTFPRELQDLHERRLRWLLERTGLGALVAPLPRALVAGSCGKASTARFLAFILRALYDREGVTAPVGLGTKPPLQETPDGHRERYQLLSHRARSTVWLSHEDFARYVTELAPSLPLVPRELGPLAPYDLRAWVLARAFVDHRVALGVVEANMGLARDPSSAWPPPSVTLLTPVGDDHAHLLTPPSPSPAALAGLGERAGPLWHKASGLPSGVPVVLGRQDPAALAAILSIAREQRTGLVHLPGPGGTYEVLSRRSGIDGSAFRLRLQGETLSVSLRALGRFQVDNAAHAAAAAQVLWDHGHLPGERASLLAAIPEGLAHADTPGRLQKLRERPTVILTMGASVTKMRGTVESVRELAHAVRPDARVVVCGTFLDRVYAPWEPVRVLAEAPEVSALVATAWDRGPDEQDLPPDTVASWARDRRPALPVFAERDPGEAVRRSLSLADPARDVVLLVGNGLGAWQASHPDALG